ncbi:MAG: hypothetical protein ACP5U2_03550 [Bryobacteraceae bacterium]
MKAFKDRGGTSRREFLAGCAGCPALALCASPAVAASQGIEIPDEKPRIRLVFTHIPPEKPTWPYQGYDYEGRKKELTARLRQSCPGVEFLPATAHNADEGRKLLESDAEVDGYLIYMVGIWSGAGMAIAQGGKPTLFVNDLYAGCGEFLTAYARARRQGLKVAGVTSSRWEDVVQAVKTFETLKKLKSSVILDVTDRTPGADAEAIAQVFGTVVERVSSEEINSAYQRADRKEAEKWATAWIKGAARVVEPTREEIGKSGVMYVAMRDLMAARKAQAITVDCLNLFYGGKLPAYPCLGFFQLNDDGLVGACEADLQSTITMLAMTYLTGRPGYISDPVIDTAKKQIIYAHCVAPSKVYGPNGARNPYHIRSHSEDRKGAAVRSLMPLGQVVSSLKFAPTRRQVVFHQARTVANVEEDKACRTKLAAEVQDPFKLLSEWDRWGWHRVTFYGDLRQPLETLAGLLGFEVIVEG